MAKFDNNFLVTTLAFLGAMSVSKTTAMCHLREIEGVIDLPNVLHQKIRYNVCVDNTTISPTFTHTQSELASFARECCGCRVSSVSERQVAVQQADGNSTRGTIFIPEIRACECIACNTELYRWADYFLSLPHKRRK